MSVTLTELLDRARADYYSRFSRHPSIAAWAPGRVNLMGDHTDYSGGLAMPCAINLYTIALAAPGTAPDGASRVVSTHGEGPEVQLPARVENNASGDWADYLRGIRAGYKARGLAMPPMDVLISGNLPLGSGLSSSASLELCFAGLLETATGTELPVKERALLCQTAEHDFAGVPCGILDQFAISHGRRDHAMILDCRSQTITHTPLPEHFQLLIIDSDVRHDLGDGAYGERRATVAAASDELGISLRDAQLNDLGVLADPLLRRRARHVVSENGRVPQFAEALAAGNWEQAGELMLASHRSLAEDFQVSCPEVDWLVSAVTEAGAFGARMTGGGFGGSVVCLAPEARRRNIDELVSRDYAAAWGRSGVLRSLRSVDAAAAMKLELS